MRAPRGEGTNLTLDNDLVLEARRLGIDVSRAKEAGLRRAVREARAEECRRENAEAIASANAWVDANGLPLARHRRFRCRDTTMSPGLDTVLHGFRAGPGLAALRRNASRRG